MKRALPTIVVIVAGLLLGQAGHTIWRGPSTSARPVSWGGDVRWVGPQEPTYQAYFRHTFYVDSLPDAAWLRLAADNSFELYVNGRMISREDTPTNNAKGLGAGLESQLYQPLSEARVYRAPIESTLAISHMPDWKLCVYEDIGKYLVSGRNVIAVAVSSTIPQPRLALEGRVQVAPTSAIDLSTGTKEWLVRAVPENRERQIWYEPAFPDGGWAQAEPLGPLTETTYSRLSETALDTSPQGRWITGPEGSLGGIWLRSQWPVAAGAERAVLRVSSNMTAGVMINGRLVDDPDQTKERLGQLLIYDVSRLVKPGDNILAVRMHKPLAEEQPALAGAPPRFYADGWVENENGELSSPISTGRGWIAFAQPPTGWFEGEGAGEPAGILGTQGLKSLARCFRGDASAYDLTANLWSFAIWLAIGITFSLSLVFAIGHWWIPSGDASQPVWRAAVPLIVPGTVAMGAILLLAHRYAERDVAIYFNDHRAALTAVVSFFVASAISLLAQWLPAAKQGEAQGSAVRFLLPALMLAAAVGLAWNEREILLATLATLAASILLLLLRADLIGRWLSASWQRVGAHRIVIVTLLAAVVVTGFALRTQGLPAQDLSPDENTSLDVIRGIARSGGAPESTSRIWYTRSPAYHYMTAAWMQIFGDTFGAAHLLSVLFGTGSLVLSFVIARQLTGSDALSLFITALLACDQWMIVIARGIRFYVVVQFLTMLCFYLFHKGFVERGKPWYRYSFFLAATAAILNQEMMITLVPIFALGFFMFYRPFELRRDWPIFVAAGATVSIFFFDLFVFYVKCLTPLVALGTTTDSIAKPHLRFVTGFLSGFFVGSARIHVVFTFFYFAGFAFSVARRDWRRVFLFTAVLLYLIELTVLVRQISVRYTSPMYPLFVILAVVSAVDIGRWLAARFSDWPAHPAALRLALPAMMLVPILFGQEYLSVLTQGGERLTKGTTEVTRYIRDHANSSDVVISPASPAAAVELGGLDYYLSANVLYFDIPFRDGNYVRDRWSGGILVSNPEAFSRVFESADRVWLYYDQVSEAKLSPEMRYYVRTTGRPVMESYAATLRLWDREKDPFPFTPREGREIGPY